MELDDLKREVEMVSISCRPIFVYYEHRNVTAVSFLCSIAGAECLETTYCYRSCQTFI